MPLKEGKSLNERVLSPAGFIAGGDGWECSNFYLISPGFASLWSLTAPLTSWWPLVWTDMMPSLIQCGSTEAVSIWNFSIEKVTLESLLSVFLSASL